VAGGPWQDREDDRALSLLSQGGEEAPPLGHLLVTRGSLEASVLEHELQELTLAIIRRASAEPALFYEFVADECPEQPDTLPDLFTAQIILIAARACDDHRAKLAALGSLERTVWRSRESDQLLQDFSLTPTEGFLLSRLEGTRSISDLLQVSALPDEQAIATLYPLIVAGVVEVGEATRRAAAPRSAAASAQPTAPPGVREESLTRSATERNIRRLPGRSSPDTTGPRAAAGVDRDEFNRALQDQALLFVEPERHLWDSGRAGAICERAAEARLGGPTGGPSATTRSSTKYKRSELSPRGHCAWPPCGRGSTVVEANAAADELVRGRVHLDQASRARLQARPAAWSWSSWPSVLRNPLWTNRALAAMRRAIEVDPEYVEAWLELALFWRRRRNQERKALKALAAEPDNPRAKQMYKELAGKRELERLLRRVQQQRD
jgi:hypothetical protein